MEERRSPYLFSPENAAGGGFSLESAISRLSLSSEDGGGGGGTTPFSGISRGGADVAAGPPRLDPPIAYQLQRGGNVEGLMTDKMPRGAHGGDFFLGFGGGAHKDLNVGQLGNWAPLAGTSGGDPILAAVSAQPSLPHRGGEYSPRFKNRDDHDPFLLRKKSMYINPTSKFPITNISQQNLIPNPNSTGPLNPSFARISEIHRPEQKCSVLSLDEFRGKIVSLAKDPTGCRILQHNLNFWTIEEIEVVLSEVIVFLGHLMKNQSGSYLIQKLFAKCSEEQRLMIILALTMTPVELISICINSYGARAMQRMLEDISSPQQMFMVMAALSLDAVTLACDTNGHLVVSFCLNNFSFEFTERLINNIAAECYRVATDIRGCRVLQLCVENARGEARERLICEILVNARHLSEDLYGNYVVQHLLEQNIPGVEETLLECLEGMFAALSCNKYASNVVEKLFSKSGENSSKIIKELIMSPDASILLVDPFANYVIQKALKVATGESRIALIELILFNASAMQSSKHGRKILSWFDRRK